jgi:predicted unusual protein kinase regulating ubiquinone biosynthesis (AarF/ABC1/UbiB family)
MGELAQIDHAEIRELADEFRELIYDMPFQLPEDLILLGRCVAILSGMCTGLEPDFNVWDAIAPVTKELIAEETIGGWEFWRDEAVDLLKTGLVLPKRLERTLALIEKGQMQVRVPELSDHFRRLEAGLARLMAALVFSVLLMGGIQMYLAGEVMLGRGLLAGALMALLWAVLRRSRRR